MTTCSKPTRLRKERFTKNTAKKMSLSERTIQRHLRVGEAIVNNEIPEDKVEKFKAGLLPYTKMIKFHKTHLQNIKKVEETTKKNPILNDQVDNITNSQKFAIRSENQEEIVFCKTCRFANVAPCPNCSSQLIIWKKKSTYFLLKSAKSEACKEYEF